MKIYAFLGAIIYMGRVKLPKYMLHWKQDSFLAVPFYRKLYQGKNLKFFHINNKNFMNPNYRLFKIRPFYLPHKSLN